MPARLIPRVFAWTKIPSIGFTGAAMFTSWIFHTVIGFFIAKLAEDRRSKEDSF